MKRFVCILAIFFVGLVSHALGQPTPKINGLNDTYCTTSSPAQMTGQPPGGTFSGDGVVFTLFIPSVAGVGVHEITYKISTPFGEFSTTKTVTVTDPPTATIDALPATVCSGSAQIPLSGSPEGGQFTGNGVKLVQGSYVFDPAGLQPGTYTITYTGGEAGCNYVTTAQIQVVQGANAQIQQLPGNVCITSPSIQAQGNPSGGTFSGPGITGGGLFTPSVAGVGQHTITYSGTGANGCPYSRTRQVRVNAVPEVTIFGISNDTTVCTTSFPLFLSAEPSGGTFDGCGMSSDGTFDPFLCEGQVTITYSGVEDGCEYSKTVKVTVVAPPSADFDLPAEICRTAPKITLTGTPAGGEFFGPGITGNVFDPSSTDVGDSADIFYAGTSGFCDYFVGKTIIVNPAPVASISGVKADTTVCAFSSAIQLSGTPAGGTFSGCGVTTGGSFAPSTCTGAVTLTYSGSSGGCDYSTTIKVNVITTFPATFGDAPAALCVNADPITLSATPPNGTFSGPGVSSNKFTPAVAGAGTFTLTYTGTKVGCAFTTTRAITVGALPTPKITGLTADTTICKFSGAVSLTGSPSGGTFTGCGVSTDGVFTPTNCTGQVEIRYAGVKDGCSYEVKLKFNVVSTFPATLSGLPNTACQSDANSTLTGTPTGGLFSGAGMSGSVFSPQNAGAGIHIITYSGNLAGCTFTASDTVTVTAVPTPKIIGLKTDTTVCAFSNAINLIGQPLGGAFSGCGTQPNGQFKPSNCPSPITVTYSGNLGGCVYSTSVTVNVVTSFQSQITNLPATACLATEPIDLTATPPGGVFGGPGVSPNNKFRPNQAGVGTHVITYQGTIAGCSFSTTQSITVKDNPLVKITGVKADSTVCAFSSALTLVGTPTGGIFSGCGVSSGGIFAPTNCEGQINITYAGSDGNCPYEKTIHLTVIKSFPAQITALPDSVCINSAALALTATPTGGVFGGPGVTGTTFTPSSAGAGKKVINYTGTQAGCPYQTSDSLIVSNVPTVTINGLTQDTTVCALSPSVQLSGVPAGGTFAGCGVSNNGLFAPAGCPAGASTVTYSGTKSGCNYSKTLNITLAFEYPATINSLPTDVCINGQALTLSGTPTNGTFSGSGVNGHTFTPSAAGLGAKTINYNGTFAGCPFGTTKTVTVNDIPVASISGLKPDTTVCALSAAVQLTGTPAGGTFTGCGVSTGGSFAPSACPEGPVTLTYSGTLNACAYSTTLTVRVKLTFDGEITVASDTVCVNSPAVALSATPTGGTFSGSGVTGSLFNPSAAGPGARVVNYTGNVSGCPYNITRTIFVSSVPTASISGLQQDTTVCAFMPALQLTGTPAGGAFSGCGVTSGGSYAPSGCGAGPNILTYSGTKSGCAYSTILKTKLVTQLTATITGLPEEACLNSSPFTLTGSPSGGTFSGSGVNLNTFVPQNAGTGLITVSYVGTFAGCPFTANKSVQVNEPPTTKITGIKADTTVCAFSNAIQLTGTPAGGAFSGCGVSTGGSFAPTACNGTITLTYSGTKSGCNYSTTVSVSVIQSFPATLSGLPDSVCVTAGKSTLVGTPSGGSFTGLGITGNKFNPAQAGPGVHIINYTGSNAGCNFGTTQQVVVTAVPNPVIQGIASDTSICRSSPSIQVTAAPSGGTFSGCGMSNNGLFTPASCNGPVTITYSGTLGGCEYTKSKTFTVITSITTTMSGLPANVCVSGAPVTLTGTPSGGSFSGPALTGNVFTPSMAGAGTYIITYSGLVGNCGYSTTAVVVVNPNPFFTATVTNPTCNLCSNGKMEINVLIGANPLTYAKDGGASQTSNLFTGLLGGTYQITVKDGNGCQATKPFEVVAPPPSCDPPTNIVVSNVAPGIANATWDVVLGAIQYQVRYRLSGAVTWNNMTTNTTNIQITGLTSQDTYELEVKTVCINGIDGGYSLPVQFTGIAFIPCNPPSNLQTSNITFNSAVVKWTPVVDVATYNVQYRRVIQTAWSLVSVTGSHTTLQNLRPNTEYVIRIRSVCGNNVGIWSAPVTFTTLNVRESETVMEGAAAPVLTVYPNPARDVFTLELSGETTPASVKVYSLTGTEVYNGEVYAERPLILDVTQWAPGAYLCKVNAPNGTAFVQKVIVVH